MPNPLDTLYDQLKGQYPDLVDRSEFIGKLSNEEELKKLHDAASKDIPGFVDFDNFKSKVGESLSTYDQDSDYKAQSASTEQESAPTDITIPRREKGRHVPSEPQNGGISSEAYVPAQPVQPTDTHVDAEAFDRETGDLDELGRRYQEKVKRLEGYSREPNLYVNEDEARKHYEAYSRLYDEAEQDRLVYNRRVKAAEEERAEQQRQLDLQSKDRKTRRSAEYGGYTNDQVRKEQERLKKERAYLEDPKSRRNADYSRRVMEYNADQTALSGEADKRNKRAESKRAMYDEVRKVAEDPDVQKRITGNDTVTYILSGNNTYALQNYDTARERAKTMSDEELVEHCKSIAGQKYARGDNKDIYAPLAAAFMAYHNELMYRLGGDEPKSALEMRYDMIDKATESSPEGDNFMVTLRNYLDGTSGMGTANFENDQSERANIPQFAVVDYFNNLLAQKEAENMGKVEQISRYPQQGSVTELSMAAAATDYNYDAMLQQAFEKFGDGNLKAYITAYALRNGVSIDEAARRVNQSIWDETIGKVMEDSRPKSNLEFFLRRITSDNMFSKLMQIGLRAQNGTLGSTDPFMVNSMALDEYAKDHPILETGAAVFNFAVMEGPIFSGYGKVASGLVGAGERAIIGAATKTADKMAIDATARVLGQSLMYRLAKGGATGALTGFQYGTMSGAIDQAYYDGNVDFGKVIANGGHMARDFAIMHGVGELFGVTGDAILRRGQRNLRNGQGVLRNRLETTSLHFLNNVAKTTTNASIVTGLYAAIDKPALERENKKIEAENKKIEAENTRLPEDKQKPLKPLNQIASVEDTFYSSLRMFAGLDAVGMLRRAWSIGVRGQYERNKHVKIHFDKLDREALEKAFGKNPNSLLRQIVFGNVDGVPAKWFEIDPEAEAEIYKELGRELTPAEKEAYATYGFTELRKVILNKDIPWATRAKIVSVVTGRIVQEPPVARGTIEFVMDKSGTVAKRIIVRSLDMEGNVIQAREFDGQREFEAARSLYESLNDRGWRNNALLCGNLVIDAIEDKTYADTVDEMAREKGIAPDQFEQMVFGIKQKDITGEKVTYQERQLVDEFDKRHQQKQQAETELAGPNKLFEQVAREVFGAEWKRALNIPSKSWGEMSEAEKEFVNRYIERIGAMGVAERNKLMNSNPDWARAAKEYEESVRRRMAEAERPAEAEPLPTLEDEKVSVEVPAEERVEPVPEVIELEEEPGKEQPTQSAGPQDTPTPVEERPAEPAAEEKPATVEPEQPMTEEKPQQAGTIGFEPVEQPTERERYDAERKAKAATITDADIEANRDALGIPEGTALTDETRQIYAEDLAEDLMRYERFKRGESDEKARFHDYWENKFNPKRPKLEKPAEKQEEPVEEEEEEVTESDALIEQIDNLKGRSDLDKYRNALTVFAGDDEIMAILEDLEPRDITEWVSSFLGLDSGKGYSMLWESKTRGGTVIAKGFKEETGWGWNDVKGFAFMFDNKNGLSPRRVAEKIWEALPSGMKNQYSDVDVFNIMLDLFKSSSRKSDLTNYIRNKRMEQVRELLNRRRSEELAEIARYKEREHRGEEGTVAEPVATDESANEFVAHEDDVAPFSLLSLNYRDGEAEEGTVRSRARTRKQLGTIAKALGYKMRWVADKPYNAKIDTDEKVLYLNIRTDMPLEAVMGHEVTHDLRKSDPKAYEALKRYAQDLLGQEQWDSEVKDVTDIYNEEYKRRGWQPIRADKAEEEVVCDTMGKVLHTKKGLRELAGSLDTTIAGKVYRMLKDITDKVKNALGKEQDYSLMDSALQEFLESVEQRAKKGMPIQDAPVEETSVEFSLRRKPAPKNTGVGYKVFYLKDGKLYPPMVANIGGEATPFGVWLDADAAPIAGKSKTGRNKVKAGGKGTQGGSGTLAYRPGWHLGKIPYALQFNRGRKVPNPLGILNKNGKVIDVGEFFPNDFVWAEVEYAADKDYQEEAHGYGVNANNKYNPSLAGLPRVPEDGSYEYRTNPNPATDPWIITGAMKVNRILKPSEVDEMVRAAGREPQKRQEGAFTDEQIDALNKQLNNTIGNTARNIKGLDGYTEQDVLDGVRGDIDAKLEDAGVNGVNIKGMALHGSRMRGDARPDSDLDVVVEYEGDISEDGLFNILNDEPMYFDGVKVDINPITRGKSGTLEQYMERSRRYDEEQLRDESTQSGTNFSLKREGRDEDKVPTFYSNAERAVEGVKQNKATAEQWKAMLTKAGGIKAGEDKWMGLSQWLDEHKGETLTKEQLLEFVRQNGVQMEERNYNENEQAPEEIQNKFNEYFEEELSRIGGSLRGDASENAWRRLIDDYGDDFDIAFWLNLNDYSGEYEVLINNVEAAESLVDIGNTPINSTRLDYTTEGLENKREIAFVVPGIEPYQEDDEIHFGPENQGRAIMWVRFGETTDTDGKRVLVIDEIQSNRHQDAREKGYEDPALTERLKQIQQEIDAATKEFGDFNDTLRQKYGVSTNYTKIEKTREEWGWNHRLVPNEDVLTKEEVQKWKEGDEKIKALKDVKDKLLVDRMLQEGVPAAPFEKNWHEVAMKRMLRLAAEEGFDKVAWTTGGQQAERYDIGNAVERIEKLDDRAFLVYPADGSPYQELEFDEDGVYRDDDDALLNNKTMADIFGKETAEKLKNMSDGDQLTGEGLRIGGEGMKGFYDQMLPRFMDKYGKRWGVKTGEVTLATPDGETMHSVDVTPEMRRSVLEQGQPLFSLKREDSQKVFDTAKRKFGETKDIREAGYVLPDGSMLDFSGRHELDPGTDSSFLAGRRATDHHAIDQISFVYDENGDEVDTGVSSDMPDFIKRGAIRIDNNAGSINLSVAPTMAQRRVLRELIRRNGGDVQVDFGDGFDSDHYVEYDGASAQRVLGDIDRYFDDGIKPEGNMRFSLKKETRTDADGNEVYTETREDGTKDREITTYGDGSKKALWYDDKGNLKERLDYFPDGEVSQVANYDNSGNITRHIQYDENRHITSYYLPAIGTDWKLDENGIARGKSNGVEIRPYNFQFSLKRRRNRDDYTDEDRADAAIIANTYLAQADALRQQIEADREREHQLVEERNRLLAFDYPAADPADRPAIMDRINDLRSQINDLRNANYENNTKLRSMDYEYRVAKEILEQGAVTDEEAARFDAGQMTREEQVLEQLFKAAADSRADKKAKQKAIRGLVRELTAITDNFKAAMKARGIESQRKHYDKGTVDHIIRLAKAMMGTGYIDNMTSYEVKRLMGMINNAATRKSIEKQAGRIVDMMLDHQIRTLRNDFNKQLKVTGQKTNSSGVQVQAGLDQEGQVVMEAMRKSMQIIADSAGERYDSNEYLTEWGEFYEKTLNDMGDEDHVKAEQARKIFEGVWLASKWYEDVRALEINDRILRSQMEDFKASNKPARDADADTKKRYNDVLADYQEMLRQNKIKIIEAYERMTGDVGMTQADSMRRAKEFADAQKRRVEDIQHNANSDLQDVDDNTQVETPESRVFGANKNNVLVRLLFASAGTYEKFMRFFGRMAPNGEGYLFKRFMTQYHHARQNYWKGRHSAFEEMDKKMAEVFGKKKMHWSDIYEMTRDHKKFPPITVSYWDGYRNGQPRLRMDELNQSEALYLYMINKMPDGRMKLRHMGITDDVVQQMAGQINNKLIQLADWLQSEFLPKMRIKYNETHKRVFGADMAAIEDYFPLRISKLAVASDMDITERDINDNKPSTITGAIVKRRVNTLPIDLHTDAFDVALSHIDEMEHWSAYAEFNRDNNTLVNYKRFRTKVNNMRSLELGAGDVLWKNFTDAVAIAADAYHPRAGSRSGDHYATRVAKFVSTAKIALRPYTALKQLLSIPAFWADSDPLEQMKATVNVANTWQWAIENLPGFAERWQSRQAGNIKLANYNDLSGLRRRKAMQRLGRAGMWANAAIDGLACAMGGKAVYETKLKRYRKMGYDEARAQEKALIDAAIAYNNSQQSSEGAYVSPLQVDRTWFANAFSVFRSASMGYTRRMNTSLRQLRNATFKPGYGAKSVEFLKKQMMRDGLTEEQAEKWAHRIYRRANLKAAASVAIFGQILPFTWNLGANMFYLLFGDDDKEKESILADSFRHSFFGPVEGLTGGNVISELGDIAADTAIGNIWGDSVWGDSEAYKMLGYREFSTMPLSSDLSSLLKYFARDEVKAANEVVNILFQVATGVNPQTITDWATAILDLSRSDMERRDIAMFAMRLLSTPQSQLDKFYLDQMNISQEQADKMSVDDLIKRYATYKRWRETPLTGWMYSDEREKEVEEKFQKRYEQMLEERSVAEDGLRGAINDIKDLPRKRTMMQKLQKELTDSIEAADPDLYKKALEGEKADDDEYVRHVTDKDVEQMAELQMKKKALRAARDRKVKADKDAEAGRITQEEYDAIYEVCAHEWKLYNYLNNTLPKKLKEWKLKMEPDMQDKYTPEQVMDTIRSKTDKALQMRPEDMKMKKGDKKKVKKNKKK